MLRKSIHAAMGRWQRSVRLTHTGNIIGLFFQVVKFKLHIPLINVRTFADYNGDYMIGSGAGSIAGKALGRVRSQSGSIAEAN